MTQLNHVMLIDDDKVFNFINREVIDYTTYAKRIKTYIKADDALSELRELVNANPVEFPDVIFLDINMPSMDGWEFLDEFKKLPDYVVENCKIFMLSSSINPADVEKSKQYRMVYDFVAKPLTADKLFLLRQKLTRF